MEIKGVIFDMDGTVVDAPYDWAKIKEELQTGGQPILEHIQSLSEPERKRKWKILERHESEATACAEVKPGINGFLISLRKRGLRLALVTNNSKKNVSYLLSKFDLEFDHVISRESGLWKPSGAPIIEAVRKMRLDRGECLVIGDSHFDIRAAAEAGIRRVMILTENRERFLGESVELFETVPELRKRVEMLLAGSDLSSS